MSQGEIYRINDAKLGDKPRSTFPLSTPHWFSMNFGRLYPVYTRLMEPGDTLSLDIKSVVRMATPVGPIMGSANLSYHAFWVPFRLVFNLAKQMFGENDETAWTRRSEVEVPYYKYREDIYFTTNANEETVLKSTLDDPYMLCSMPWNANTKAWVDLRRSFIYGANKLLDYLGEHPFLDTDNFPVDIYQKAVNAGIQGTTISHTVCVGEVPAMLVRAVWLIWNEYYRDENYQDVFLFEKGLVPQNTSLGDYIYPFKFPYGNVSKSAYDDVSDDVYVNEVPIVCKKHDLLTNMLPEPQRGPTVNILAAAGLAPVVASGNLHAGGDALKLGGMTNGLPSQFSVGSLGIAGPSNLRKGSDIADANYANGSNVSSNNLYSDLSASAGLTLNAFRISVLTSQFYETLGVFGERYNEFIYGLFGVRVSDSTIDRPEYLGGISFPIGTYQVPQTSAGASGQTQLGDLGAFGYGDDKSSLIYKSFSEFGYVIVFASARIDHNYPTLRAPESFWRNRLEFHYPLMDGMGMVPYLKKYYNPILDWKTSTGVPIFHSAAVESESKGDETVGFKEAWWNMRSKTPTVSGVFNPGNIFSLDHLTYIEKPSNDINQGPLFVSAFEEALIVDRTLQLGSLASIYGQQLQVMQMQDESLTRIIRVNSRPGLTRI